MTTGISDATHVAIVSGIKKGDLVITGPFKTLKKLNDGDAIEVVKEEKKPPAEKRGLMASNGAHLIEMHELTRVYQLGTAGDLRPARRRPEDRPR